MFNLKNMKSKIGLVLIGVFFLSGCLGRESSGKPIGGVMRSDDSGKTFLAKSKISEKASLIKMSVLSLAIDPSNSNTIYAGTQANGLFISEDNGEIWKPLNLAVANIGGIVLNPQNTRNFFTSGMSSGRGSIFRTDDKGETFRRIYIEPIDGTNISALNINPENPDIIYAGTNNGVIIRSFNGGETWENLYNMKGISVLEILFDVKDSKTIYLLTSNNGVFKSRDSGLTFISLDSIERNDSQEMYSGSVYSLAIHPTLSGSLFVGTNNGIFQSKDYGYSWEKIDTIASTDNIPIYALAINPHDTNQIVYGAGKAIYTSNGNTWAITDTTSNQAVNVIKHDPVNNGIIYLGMSGK